MLPRNSGGHCRWSCRRPHLPSAGIGPSRVRTTRAPRGSSVSPRGRKAPECSSSLRCISASRGSSCGPTSRAGSRRARTSATHPTDGIRPSPPGRPSRPRASQGDGSARDIAPPAGPVRGANRGLFGAARDLDRSREPSGLITPRGPGADLGRGGSSSSYRRTARRRSGLLGVPSETGVGGEAPTSCNLLPVWVDGPARRRAAPEQLRCPPRPGGGRAREAREPVPSKPSARRKGSSGRRSSAKASTNRYRGYRVRPRVDRSGRLAIPDA